MASFAATGSYGLSPASWAIVVPGHVPEIPHQHTPSGPYGLTYTITSTETLPDGRHRHWYQSTKPGSGVGFWGTQWHAATRPGRHDHTLRKRRRQRRGR